MGNVPPLEGEAVKVTEVPVVEQIEVEVELIETEGVTSGFTVTEVCPALLVQPFTVTVTL